MTVKAKHGAWESRTIFKRLGREFPKPVLSHGTDYVVCVLNNKELALPSVFLPRLLLVGYCCTPTDIRRGWSIYIATSKLVVCYMANVSTIAH
jgi:hypothetical protein